MLKNYVCPDCGLVVSEGSTSCVRCGCKMSQIVSGRKTPVKLPYTQWAGHNDVASAPRDKYGNPNGSNYDLLRDGSMKGYKILIVNYWNGRNINDYTPAINALKNKGFDVIYTESFPLDFASMSQTLSQLWIMSGSSRRITDSEISQIKNFYNSGHGLYLWADNDPLFADVNPIIQELVGSYMSGDYDGDTVIGVQKNPYDVGIVRGHLIATGISNFYEGITISNVAMNQNLKPLVYSSDKKVVTAYSEAGGKRLLIDGGFTRLYYKWDSAGTDRYVVNAAGWLGNFERFGWRIPK